MPTGYTAGVGEGTIKDFRSYAIQCARNFGALIMMRDDPLDAEIDPSVFEPSDYHTKQLDNDRAELKRVQCLSDTAVAIEHEQYVRDTLARREKSILKNAEIRRRYERMLSMCRLFEPPTDQHVNYAEFLKSQLNDSIKWDCGHVYPDEPTADVRQWHQDRIAQLRRSIVYHEREHAEEVGRCRQRRQWFERLMESIVDTEKRILDAKAGDEIY